MTDPENLPATDVERFRGYLYVLAERQAHRRLQGKVDASDIVQQTLVQAWEARSQFRGRSDAELAAWLRQILARQLANAERDWGRQKRDAARDRSLEAALDESASRLELVLAAADSSPSQKAQRNEQDLRQPALGGDGRRVVFRTGNSLEALDWVERQSQGRWSTAAMLGTALAVDPSGRWLAAWTRQTGELSVWNRRPEQRPGPCRGPRWMRGKRPGQVRCSGRTRPPCRAATDRHDRRSCSVPS